MAMCGPTDGIAAGAALSFARAIAEYGSLVLLSGNLPYRTEVVSVRVLSFIEGGNTAAAAAVASLDHEDALLKRVEAIVAERGRVLDGLREQGWDVPDAQGNFVWLELGDRTGECAAAAEQAGIMVRPFAGEGVRVTVGEPEANDVFLAVAASFRGGGGGGV